MNKQQRKVWLALSQIEIKAWPLNLSLCHLCKYQEWEGHCEEAFLACQHKSEYIQEKSSDVWEGCGTDCSGFYPYTSLDITAEYISQLMQGKNVNLPTRQYFKEVNKK